MYEPRTSPPNSYSHLTPGSNTMNIVEKTRKPSQEHGISQRDWYSEVQFRPIHQETMKSNDFGVMGSLSPARSPSHPLLSHRGGHQSSSPDSRAQAIARGRSELMEMVRHMPESNYELSLKDIVEHHHGAENQAPKTGDSSQQRAVVKVKKEESKRVDRNLSFENKGLFLNMAFPFTFKSKKRKKVGGSNSGRVSPKPEGLKIAGERDWWKKKFTGSSDSDSSRTSYNSGTSASTVSSGATASSGGGDRDRRGRNGCFHIFTWRRSSKSAE